MQQTKNNLVYVTFITIVATLGGLLFGYDTAVISGAIGFVRNYFDLNSAMMGWVASSALVGCIAGCAMAGYLSDRFGRKKILILSSLLFAITGIGCAIADSTTGLVIYRIIGGIGVGIASMLSPIYIAEIAPAHMRGRLVSYNQFAIVTGMLVVYFVNYFIAARGNESWNLQEGWRWMFGSETIPALLFLLFLFFIPESPRWLAKNDQIEKSRRVLLKIGGSGFAEKELSEIRDTEIPESNSFRALFQGKFRIVLIIGIILAILQQVTGINVFLYYAPEIFKKLGTGTNTALLQTIIVGFFNLTFTIVAILTVDKFGRKPLMIIGSLGMGLCLMILGLMAYFQQSALWVLVFILGYISCFALSVGPVTWVIISEIFPTRIRGRALSIATVFLWTANWVVSQTFPMLDENQWLADRFHHGFSFLIYGSMCFILLVFMWRRVPETKGKSLEEIERLWLLE
jgi:SP family xylose:H+ symportor-like MFS transporter